MRRFWLVALTVILAIFCGWLFTVAFEQYEEEIDIGYTKEARLNPFLAAKYFLEDNNVKVNAQTSVLDFNRIPHGDTVFISSVDSMLLSKSQIDKAVAWVNQGGFLIVGAGKEIKGHDSFLKRFDIEPKRIKYQEDAGELAEALIEAIEQDKERALYTIKLSDDEGQLQVQSLDNIVLNHAHVDESADASSEASLPYKLTASVSDHQGPRLLQFDYGKGGFVVLSSTKFWRNKSIGKADHAYLLAYLVPKKTTIHYFYNVTSPALWEILKSYFLELIIASVLLLVLWLWRAGLRVQGIKPVTDGQRRQFDEHLTASAEFLVSKNQYQTLITPIKEDIALQMQRFHPGFTQLDQQEQTVLLAQRAEMPIEKVQAWVDYTHTVNSQEALIAALKLGKGIRRKL